MSRWQEDFIDEYDIEFDDRLLEEYRSRSYFDRAEQSNPSTSGFWLTPLCPHPPQRVLTSKESGWDIYAGAGPDCMDRLSGFDLLLNLTGSTVFRGHVIPLPALQRWNPQGRTPEIVLDWPDMGIVALPKAFWKALIAYLAENKAKMLVFCVGGHGRTGTAIASLMVASGWTGEDAVAWVRAHYCGRAIETDEQAQYVRWLAGDGLFPSDRPALSRSPSSL